MKVVLKVFICMSIMVIPFLLRESVFLRSKGAYTYRNVGFPIIIACPVTAPRWFADVTAIVVLFNAQRTRSQRRDDVIDC